METIGIIAAGVALVGSMVVLLKDAIIAITRSCTSNIFNRRLLNHVVEITFDDGKRIQLNSVSARDVDEILHAIKLLHESTIDETSQKHEEASTPKTSDAEDDK